MDYSNTSDVNLLDSMMKEIIDKIAKLWDLLMGLEMQLVDQLEVRDSKNKRAINGKGPFIFYQGGEAGAFSLVALTKKSDPPFCWCKKWPSHS